MFDHRQWTKTFLENPGYNDAKDYDVLVVRNATQGPFKIIGVHHLTPEENSGKQNIFVDIIDEKGRRMEEEKAEWTWKDRRRNQNAPPLGMDKPANECPDIPIWGGMVISVWHPDGEKVLGIRSSHPDEKKPNGELGNMIGHHSFLVVFQKMEPGSTLPEPPPTIPPDEPSPPGVVALDYKFITPDGPVTQHQEVLANESKEGWIAYSACYFNGRVHYFLRKVAE